MSTIWFSVPLCDDCWDIVSPGRKPTRLKPGLVEESCSRCRQITNSPIYVRTCYPPHDVIPLQATDHYNAAAELHALISARQDMLAFGRAIQLLCDEVVKNDPMFDRETFTRIVLHGESNPASQTDGNGPDFYDTAADNEW